jgi:hypothetical protein
VKPAIADVVNRELTAEELRAYVDQPVTSAEREGLRDLVRWFTTRYPTPLERLAYVRRASVRWSRTRHRES